MDELDTPYELSDDQISFYRENGYIKLKQVLSAETLADYGAELTRIMRDTPPEGFMTDTQLALMPEALRPTIKEAFRTIVAENPDSTYAAAFTQRTNLCLLSEKIMRFIHSKRLGKIAADLMGTKGVRLFHDQALYKEAHGGHTPWHCDQFYWPLATDKTTTVWIPLQAVSAEMGPLAFAKGSHLMEEGTGRDLAISDESEEVIGKLMEGYEMDDTPFDLGEVSFHAGWTFHRAGANNTATPREVFTIIYMDRDMPVKAPENKNQASDLMLWIPGGQAGEVAASPLNPILFEYT